MIEKARNDEIGLIVVGIDAQKHGYVLADHSGRYSPETWGSKAVALYRQFKADRIVAEANFGGAMVESTIRVVDRSAPVKLVQASLGTAIISVRPRQIVRTARKPFG